MKDLTEFSKDQQDKMERYLATYGCCFIEAISGKKVKDRVLRSPANITTIIRRGTQSVGYSSLELKGKFSLFKDNMLIPRKLTWFQKLMLKIAGLM